MVVGPNCKVFNFTYSYVAAPNEVADSNNVSIVSVGKAMFYHNTVMGISNLYATGELMSNSSAIIGLTSFKMDKENNLNFEATFPIQNTVEATIPVTTVTSYKSLVYLDFIVLGVPFCLSNQYLATYPQADCWTCDPLSCLTCSGSFCSSCTPNRYFL